MGLTTLVLRSIAGRTLPRARRPHIAAALVWLSLVCVGAVAASFSNYAIGADVVPSRAHLPPATTALLGTDHLGRDVFWRSLYATHAFLGPGFLAAAVSTVLGVPAGAMSGFYGGWVAGLVRFIASVVSTLPRFVFVLLVCTVYGSGPTMLALATGVAYAPTLVEAVHARISELRDRSYIDAQRAHGVPDWQILWIHLVAAASSRRIARHALMAFAYFLALETTLAYIGGFGVQEPFPSWGNMLVFSWGRGAHPVAVVAPAAALWLTVLSLTWVSEIFAEGDLG
jgi:peptide/nickel transport system permease protein